MEQRTYPPEALKAYFAGDDCSAFVDPGLRKALDYAVRAQMNQDASIRELVVRECSEQGIELLCFESTVGVPGGDAEHPEILRAADGREVARFWREFDVEERTIRTCYKVAPEFFGRVVASDIHLSVTL